jgi:hypothetical protein
MRIDPTGEIWGGGVHPLREIRTVATLELMENPGKQKQGGGHTFEDDTDEKIVLPRPVPEISADDEEKRADAAFDDLEIDVDDDEVKAESENQPSGRKY